MPAKKNTYSRPDYADHSEIPPGTGIFLKTVLEIYPASYVTVWRRMKAGKFPTPTGYIGDRPFWNIDIIRALMNSTSKRERAA